MAVRPIPRKRRREKDKWKTLVISCIAASLYPLARIALVFLASVVITFIVHLIKGNFSGFLRTIGAEALYALLSWFIFCLAAFIPTAVSEMKSGKQKNYPSDDKERVDKIDRNVSRKRLAKQKTLAREAAKRKQQKK